MVLWPTGVNKSAYGMNTGVKENIKVTEFESGKSRSFLLNSAPQHTFSFNIDFWSDEEERAFWTWYDHVLLSGSESFLFPDLFTHTGNTEYIMTDTPSVSGQMPKTVSITVREV
ncbi:hypothetical protein HMPREF0860_1605 [Treponema socranskii subsp. socranskii VPI DR56BR1116 = ATCC 35536]|uniref:Uncharacterized protein n=1 Tax=Treponema socranskii subsp. socranskii VPI DR56BR1116 = ATCC 35536 TaxID=1125725 RepID=U1GV06_TRESO|nr:hypothetical protein [Treponema socranskii]ERF61750.1 hypothetical protein HMPREF1325_1341 [Treponema socranskii subsp. socranskii VPI DR56BR1116 = ATCC 35536]ERK05115.1 hypothetical protein HMPREF0860_1605 [Treponema socranskii subsp. socranskii VPI DR56BR1116 = ATCC 35536]